MQVTAKALPQRVAMVLTAPRSEIEEERRLFYVGMTRAKEVHGAMSVGHHGDRIREESSQLWNLPISARPPSERPFPSVRLLLKIAIRGRVCDCIRIANVNGKYISNKCEFVYKM